MRNTSSHRATTQPALRRCEQLRAGARSRTCRTRAGLAPGTGVGSARFGAGRELAAYQATMRWVLDGVIAFPCSVSPSTGSAGRPDPLPRQRSAGSIRELSAQQPGDPALHRSSTGIRVRDRAADRARQPILARRSRLNPGAFRAPERAHGCLDLAGRSPRSACRRGPASRGWGSESC